MKNRQSWFLLAGIVCLGAAFWFLNFRMAASNTQSEKNITTTSIGDGLPNVMQRREKINLVLDAESPSSAALQRALALEVNNAGIGDIELVRGTEPKYQGPVLVVEVGSRSLLWTPFFATSQFTIQAGYSSNGDTTFMGETPVTIDNRDGPALHMYGEYRVRDRSWGLISRPAYHQSLADYLAQQIIATLKELYRVSTSWNNLGNGNIVYEHQLQVVQGGAPQPAVIQTQIMTAGFLSSSPQLPVRLLRKLSPLPKQAVCQRGWVVQSW